MAINVVIPADFGKGGARLTDQDSTGLKAILQSIVDAVAVNDRILRNNSLTLTTTTTASTTT